MSLTGSREMDITLGIAHLSSDNIDWDAEEKRRIEFVKQYCLEDIEKAKATLTGEALEQRIEIIKKVAKRTFNINLEEEK